MKVIRTLNDNSEVRTVCLSSNDSKIASGNDDGQVKIWETMSGLILKILKGHTKRVNSVTFSTKDKLASGSFDGIIKLWDNTWSNIKNMRVNGNWIYAVCFSSNETRIVSGSGSKNVGYLQIFNTSTGNEIT